MRDTDQPQEPSGLGRKVQPKAPDPKPLEKVREGVYKDADGRMFTELPEPPQSPTIWDAFKKAGMI